MLQIEAPDRDTVLAQYQTSRIHSFWSSYARILQLTRVSLRSVDPTSMAVKKVFAYAELANLIADHNNSDQIIIDYGSKRYVFKTEHRLHLLTHLFKYVCDFHSQSMKREFFVGKRIRKNSETHSCKLLIEPYGIIEYSLQDGVLQEYLFCNITRLGYEQKTSSFTFEFSGRLKIFTVDNIDLLLSKVTSQLRRLGHRLTFHNQSLSDAISLRNGIYNNVGTFISYFEVNKQSQRHHRSSSRKLYVSDRYVVEKDAAGFEFVSIHQLVDVFCLRRSSSNPREFAIEYSDDTERTYTCVHRDTLLATLIDATHAVGNARACVKGYGDDGLRMLPKFATKDQERALTYSILGSSSIELWSLHALVKHCRSGESGMTELVRACKDFNANVTCPGIGASTDLIVVRTCIAGLLGALDRCLQSATESHPNLVDNLPTLLQSLYRLAPCVAGYKAFVSAIQPDSRHLFLQLLKMDSDFVRYWAIEVLLVLIRCPLLPRDLQQEYINRHTLLTEDIIRSLIDLIGTGIPDDIEEAAELSSLEGSMTSTQCEDRLSTPTRPAKVVTRSENERAVVPNSLIIISASSLLESVLSSGRDSTSPELADVVLDLLSQSADTLLLMLKSSSVLIVENAAILIHVLLRKRNSISSTLRECALIDGLVLRHFLHG